MVQIYVDGLAQDCSNSIAIKLELLQSCIKPTINSLAQGCSNSIANALELQQSCIRQSIDGLVQDCSNSIANALELLQSCTKPLTCSPIIGCYLKKTTKERFLVVQMPNQVRFGEWPSCGVNPENPTCYNGIELSFFSIHKTMQSHHRVAARAAEQFLHPILKLISNNIK